MSEKGDMPGGDTISLPPTYAPSETYTDENPPRSPPPAYRGAMKSSRVQMVKMVCVTVVVSAFIIGFFIITSNYLNARACQCPQTEAELEKLRAAGFFEPPRASGLVDLQSNNNLEEEEEVKGEGKQLLREEGERRQEEVGGNDLDLGDDTTLTEEDMPLPREKEVEAIVEAERELEEELVREEEELVRAEEAEEEALRDVLEAQVEHMKKIRLPIDLIIGNPALAGRDVNCEVERRQQPLGPGIMTQAIIVTCSDPDDDQRRPQAPPPPQLRRPGPGPVPPLSILGPIMKMLAARPLKPRPLPCGPNTPCGLSSGPAPLFPGMVIEGRSNSGPISIQGPMAIRGPIPILAPEPPMAPEPREGNNDGPRNKMLPIHLQPLVRVSPRMPRLLAPPQPFPGGPHPMSLASLHRGALPLPMPQPRAAQDPISLPGIRLRPNPFLPKSLSVVRGARRIDAHPAVATHMEMRAPPPPPPPSPSPHHHQQPPRPEAKKDFGPPRVHTVITPRNNNNNKNNNHPEVSIQRAIHQHIMSPPKLPHNIRIQTNPMPKEVMMPPKPIALLPDRPSPLPFSGPAFSLPPPRFDPNGRVGKIREINPEAEIFVKDLPVAVLPPQQQQQKHQPPQSPPQPPQQTQPQSPPSPPPQQQASPIVIQPASPPQPSPPQSSQPRKHHLLLVN